MNQTDPTIDPSLNNNLMKTCPSSQHLFGDARTKGIVNSFAENQKLFFEKFSNAVVKLSQLDVLTGKQGQIRAKCSFPNTKKVLTSMVEEGLDLSAQMWD